MMRIIPLGGVVAMGLGFFANQGAAQVSAMRESTFHPTTVAVEVKPLPLALAMIPGVGSFGAGVELSAQSNVSTYMDGYVIDANLPSGLRDEGNENDHPVVQKMQGYSGDIGARIYSRGLDADSWYGGGKVGYSLAIGQWGYKGEKVDSATRSLTPGLEAGYRWIWASRVLFRLGAGLDGNIIQENSASPSTPATEITADGEDKVKEYARVAVIPRVDMGLGYAF